ncbi:MAG: hypothetical protein ABIH83_02865 [Candidatus Micrarchaeota archaeon]
MKAFCIIALLLLSAFAYANGSNGTVSAQGGNITSIQITSFSQHSDRWYAFYGSANSSAGNATFSLSSNIVGNTTDATRLMNFTQTYHYYFISDDSSPFSGNYSVPTLSAFDSHFSLTGAESSSYVFNETTSFAIYTDSAGSTTALSLPTLYLAGQYANGTENPQAFKQGIVQRGSSYLFIVPSSSAKGFDGRTFDYEFALPYSISSSNTFYLFAVTAPVTSVPTTGGDIVLPLISFTWSYDSKNLRIETESGATISMYNELGSSFYGTANSGGVYTTAAPSGFKYYISVSKSGFRSADTSIYIPPPVHIIQQGPGPGEGQGAEGRKEVFVGEREGKAMICIDEECYESDVLEAGSVELLVDLSCTGDVCHFVGTTEDVFKEKYGLRQIPVKRPKREPTSPVADVGVFFDTLGYELSSSLGSVATWPERDRNFFLYSFVFFAAVAAFAYYFGVKGKKKWQGGYG